MGNNRIGTYKTIRIPGESYQAYLPPKLPPNPLIDIEKLYPYLEKATLALAELNGVIQIIPNIDLFIYMYVRKEALLSSQIEGTQSSFSDLILFEHQQKTDVSLEDVEEVSHYVRAIHYGLERIEQGFPLSLRLLCEIHGVLLSGGRGKHKLPGEFRKSQNWIGGTRPGNAFFVPPPPENLMEHLYEFEKFICNTEDRIPVLIKAGLAHVQFETIHPFLDGNGRLGRLLITLLFCTNGIINQPVLYLSLYLKQNRILYYELLQQVRIHGTWEVWLEFFLEGIFGSAKQAVHTAKEINKLFDDDLARIEVLGRAKFSCRETLECLKKLPQISVPLLSQQLNITSPTARSSLNHLLRLGILEESSGKKRDKIYVYRKYLDLLEEGTDPIV